MTFAARITSCLALLVTLSPLAAHADAFNFSVAGTGLQSTGVVTYVADPTHSGEFDVTAISGEVNGTAITGLLAGSYNAASPTGNNNNVFIFDNLIFAATPALDYNGIGFNIGTAGYQGNFYFTQGNYFFLDSNGANTMLTSLSVTPVAPTPEPSSLVLLGTGIVGAAGALRRKLR